MRILKLSFHNVSYFIVLLLLVTTLTASSQSRRLIYNPCFLKDSVDQHLFVIEQSAWRIFSDTASCKGALLDSIAKRYIITKDAKYLQVLSAIRQNPNAKVEDFYTDLVSRLFENDFHGFIQQLYIAHGRLAPLQTEMIAAMNMIVNGHTQVQKYITVLNAEIEKAANAKDRYKSAYLEKLKQKIQEEKYR